MNIYRYVYKYLADEGIGGIPHEWVVRSQLGIQPENTGQNHTYMDRDRCE
jgi:hypothetical protein